MGMMLSCGIWSELLAVAWHLATCIIALLPILPAGPNSVTASALLLHSCVSFSHIPGWTLDTQTGLRASACTGGQRQPAEIWVSGGCVCRPAMGDGQLRSLP